LRILGLTGSIAMGKSTAARMLKSLHLPVFDADAEVHALQRGSGKAVRAIEAAFPGTVVDGTVDRQKLGARVFADPAALKKLESILHPAVRARMHGFIAAKRRQRRRLIVLDIPLLYEGGSERFADAVVVVSAPAFLQRQRLMRRPGMTPTKMRGILARQMTDAEKRARADFVVSSGLGRAHTFRRLQKIVRLMRPRG
jgi:dephospho-CoA kinase